MIGFLSGGINIQYIGSNENKQITRLPQSRFIVFKALIIALYKISQKNGPYFGNVHLNPEQAKKDLSIKKVLQQNYTAFSAIAFTRSGVIYIYRDLSLFSRTARLCSFAATYQQCSFPPPTFVSTTPFFHLPLLIIFTDHQHARMFRGHSLSGRLLKKKNLVIKMHS